MRFLSDNAERSEAGGHILPCQADLVPGQLLSEVPAGGLPAQVLRPMRLLQGQMRAVRLPSVLLRRRPVLRRQVSAAT